MIRLNVFCATIISLAINGQYASAAGPGADGSPAYGIGYDDPYGPEADRITLPGPGTVAGLYVNNTAYAALSMLEGDAFAKRFGGTDGSDPDWFLLTIDGRDAAGGPTGTVGVYLADYRDPDPARDYVLTEWTWVDLTGQGDSHVFNDNRDPTLNNHWVDVAAAMHAPGQPLQDPGISPLYGEFDGFPPTMITTGSLDLLLSDCLRLTHRLRAADVSCDLRVWEGLWHVFEFYPIPEAQTSIAEMAAFVKAHT